MSLNFWVVNDDLRQSSDATVAPQSASIEFRCGGESVASIRLSDEGSTFAHITPEEAAVATYFTASQLVDVQHWNKAPTLIEVHEQHDDGLRSFTILRDGTYTTEGFEPSGEMRRYLERLVQLAAL